MKFKLIIVLIFLLLISAFWVWQQENSIVGNKDVDFIRGNNAFFDQQYDLARQYYLADLISNPHRLDSLENLSTTYIKGNGQNITESIKYTKRLVEHPDILQEIDINLIKSIEKMGMSDEFEYLKNTLKSNVLLAQLWLFSDPQKAKQHITSVSPIDHDLDYYYLSAQIHSVTEDYQQALSDINRVIDLGTLDSAVYFLKSQMLMRMRRIDQAQIVAKIYGIVKSFERRMSVQQKLEKLRSAFELDHTLSDNPKFKVQYISSLLESGDLSLAIDQFDELDFTLLKGLDKIQLLSPAVQYKADHIIERMYQQSSIAEVSGGEAILYCHGLVDLIEMTDVVEYCRKTLNKYPEVAPLYFWYGMALLAVDDIDNAIKNLIQAIDYSPWVDQWRLHLAQIYLTQGQPDLAKKVVNASITGNIGLIEQFKKRNGL